MKKRPPSSDRPLTDPPPDQMMHCPLVSATPQSLPAVCCNFFIFKPLSFILKLQSTAAELVSWKHLYDTS
jgi:hypothetical protein